MLKLDDGGGLWSTTGLIDTVIVELNEIECKGVDNYAHIISCIQKLSSIRKAIEELQNRVEERDCNVDSEDESGSGVSDSQC